MEWLGVVLLYLISGFMKKRQQNARRREIESDSDWDSGKQISENVKESKPSPEIFLKICKLANFSKEECLIFEDSKNGIIAAQEANIPFIDVTVNPFSLLLKNFRNLL